MLLVSPAYEPFSWSPPVGRSQAAASKRGRLSLVTQRLNSVFVTSAGLRRSLSIPSDGVLCLIILKGFSQWNSI